MFWNDIKEIKKDIDHLKDQIFRLDGMLTCHISDLQEIMIDKDPHDKIYEYMKNVDKLNILINEFKGCVSMSRAALEERKVLNKSKGGY